MKKEYYLIIFVIFGLLLILIQFNLKFQEPKLKFDICNEIKLNNSKYYTKIGDYIYINERKYSYYGTLLNCEIKK